MTPDEVRASIALADKTFQLTISALADQLRQEHVIPFCDKYGVWFGSIYGSGGDWGFWGLDGYQVMRRVLTLSAFARNHNFRADLATVEARLEVHVELCGNSEIGFYVDEYPKREEDEEQ